MSNPYFKPINYYIENKFVCNKEIWIHLIMLEEL